MSKLTSKAPQMLVGVRGFLCVDPVGCRAFYSHRRADDDVAVGNRQSQRVLAADVDHEIIAEIERALYDEGRDAILPGSVECVRVVVVGNVTPNDNVLW